MKPPTKQALQWSLASCAIGLLIPSLIIFCLEIFVGHIPPLTSITDILHRQFAEGHNLFLIAALGLIPFAAFSAACFIAARWLSPPRLACVALGGLLGILLLMIPAHVAVWYPLYGPGRMSSTAVIAFVFIPFYCLASLSVGLLIGWLISRLSHFRPTLKPA
jgi:hypothetical protein